MPHWFRVIVRGFYKYTCKSENFGIIANFVFVCICNFLLYLYRVMLVNVTLDNSGHERITF